MGRQTGQSGAEVLIKWSGQYKFGPEQHRDPRIGTFAYSIAAEPSVLVVIDDVAVPRTTLLTGLRVNREESSYTYDDYCRVIHFPAFGEPTQNVDNVVTGKAGLQYQITNDIMAFAFYAKGYKGVAYDLVTGLSAAEAASFPLASGRRTHRNCPATTTATTASVSRSRIYDPQLKPTTGGCTRLACCQLSCERCPQPHSPSPPAARR
jgi:outer membrane receptor protein involved in Fe transport